MSKFDIDPLHLDRKDCGMSAREVTITFGQHPDNSVKLGALSCSECQLSRDTSAISDLDLPLTDMAVGVMKSIELSKNAIRLEFICQRPPTPEN